MRVYLDLETYSFADLRRCGPYVYAEHPSTGIFCMAYAVDDGPVELWVEGDPVPDWYADDEVELHAHNAQFERAILSGETGQRYGFGPVSCSRWHCTAAKCAAAALPRSLDKAAKALGLKQEKDGDGHALMLRMCKPRLRPKKIIEALGIETREEYTAHVAQLRAHEGELTPAKERDWWEGYRLFADDEENLAKLYAYCKQDVVVEREIDQIVPDLPKAEQELYTLDQEINSTGIPIDLELVEAAIDCIQTQEQRLCKELKEITTGRVTTGTQVERIVNWLNGQGVNIERLDKASVAEALTKPMVHSCHRVLEIRQELASSATKKFHAMEERTNKDGRARGAHLYHGASTGRWSGVGIQFQNVARGGLTKTDTEIAIDLTLGRELDTIDLIFGGVSHTLKGLVRAAVKGDRPLVCVDFAGIEARVLAALAGQEYLLKAFHDGEDIYKIMAGRIYGKDATTVNKDERQLGKIAILGLGYGMGRVKFRETCATMGINVDESLAQRVVDIYRETNYRIRELWGNLDGIAKAAVRDHAGVFASNDITATMHGKWLTLELPSGRKLWYYSPRIVDGELLYKTTELGQWRETKTYGGKLTENVVQAVARDLLAGAMIRADRAGYRILFHVHDEIVAEAQDGDPERLEKIMCELPKWAAGWPIAAEGFVAMRYRK